MTSVPADENVGPEDHAAEASQMFGDAPLNSTRQAMSHGTENFVSTVGSQQWCASSGYY